MDHNDGKYSTLGGTVAVWSGTAEIPPGVLYRIDWYLFGARTGATQQNRSDKPP